MNDLPKYTEEEIDALEWRAHRLATVAQRAVEAEDHKKAERYADKSDRLYMALASYENGNPSPGDLNILHYSLGIERFEGNV